MEKAGFDELIEIMAKLRSPEGCPWDREQTHDSIKGHLVEEAFEVIDALERRNFPDLKEELGDLLLQVVFHSRMAEEAGLFNIDDVVGEIVAKLKRRHPHVFGDIELETSGEVLTHWERIKAGEKDRSSALSGVPEVLPALAYSQKLQEKAARVGFDWEVADDILEKLAEETAEFIAAEPRSRQSEDEFGDILFTLVNLARHLGIDSELALRRVGRKFKRRFEAMEALAREDGSTFADVSLENKERLWERVKNKEDE